MSFRHHSVDETSYGSSSHAGDDEYTRCHGEVYDNIKSLKNLFETISKQAQEVGSKRDSSKLRSQLKSNVDTTTSLVKETQSIIKRLAALCDNSLAGKERKTRVDKLNQDFVKFNEKIRELIRLARDKVENTPVPPESRDNTLLYSRSPSQQDEDEQEHTGLLNSSYQQQHQQQQRQDDLTQLEDELNFQDGMIRDRDQQIRSIQNQMVQVNEIFRDIARLVEDQGEMVDNIQTNIVSASQNVEAGAKEVKEAEKSQQSSRKKLCFLAVFVTVILAVIIIVVVVLTKDKKA